MSVKDEKKKRLKKNLISSKKISTASQGSDSGFKLFTSEPIEIKIGKKMEEGIFN